MTGLRTIVMVVLLAVGAYYAFLGLTTLLDLPGVTGRWIEASGDPHFRLDYGLFLMLIVSGAVWVGLLGVATVAEAIKAMKRQNLFVGWGLLAVMVTLIHVPWLVYSTIATGLRPEAAAELTAFAVRSTLIMAVYVLGWALSRRRSDDPHQLADMRS